MVNPSFGAATSSLPSEMARTSPVVPPVPVGFAEQQTMTLMAERTGGRAFYNANEIHTSIRRALDDSELTYTVGFYVNQNEMDSKFHETKVTVARKGVELRARKGYFAYADTTQSETSRDIVMRQALFANLDATALPVTVRLVREGKANAINVASLIDPKRLLFAMKDGQLADAIDFVIAQQGADGRNLKVDAEVLNLAFTPARYRQVLAQDIQFGRSVELQPETRMIRVMFYDRSSGLIGSARGSVNIAQ